MAVPWLAISAGINIASSLFGGKASDDAAKRAKELGRLNADYIGQETAEQTRRLKFSQGRTRATARASIAASGFRSGKDSMGGSQRAYLKTLREVQSSELAWLGKSGRSRAEIARKGGESEASRLHANAIGGYGRAIGSAAELAFNVSKSKEGFGG